MTKRVALYLRVSTSGQTVENQRRELREVAARQGWEIVREFEDAGISGAKGRVGRPGLDAMLKGVTRKEFEIVAAWSVVPHILNDNMESGLTDLFFLRN